MHNSIPIIAAFVSLVAINLMCNVSVNNLAFAAHFQLSNRINKKNINYFSVDSQTLKSMMFPNPLQHNIRNAEKRKWSTGL